MPRLRTALLSLVALIGLTGAASCTGSEQGATAADGSAATAGPTSGLDVPRTPAPTASPFPEATATGEAVGAPTSEPAPADAAPAPLAPPPGPAVVRTTPTGRPQPGTLQVVDWGSRARADSQCRDARAGAASYGDLDADGRDEAAVPVACGADRSASEVLVYAGEPRDVRLLGRALAREQQERVHAVEFRERHLVVTTLAHSSDDRSGEADTAVTTRWVVRSGVLERTDRWEDPAYVLETDEE